MRICRRIKPPFAERLQFKYAQSSLPLYTMAVHNNVHIPSESWPGWTWYAIEFGIVMAVSMLLSREITDSIEGLDGSQQNWVFYSIVGGIFLLWYVIIRGFVLKKKILNNRY